MNKLLRLIPDHPRATLLCVGLLTGVALLGIFDLETGRPRVRINPSSDVLLPAEGEQRAAFQVSRRMLGGDDPIVVVLGLDDVFSASGLALVARMTGALEEIDGVSRVLSMANAINIRSVDGDLEIAPLYEEVPGDPLERARLKADLFSNPMYTGTLAARDGRAAGVFVYLDEMSDLELIDRRLDDRITAVAREIAGDHELWISGFPHFKANMSATLQSELAFVLPVVVGILALSLMLAFRSVRGVLIPLGTIALALIWTLGAIGWLGGSLNVITVIVPPLILTVGFAYAMHVVDDYIQIVQAAGDAGALSPREVVGETLDTVGVAVLVTGLTTAAGFLALSLSAIPGIQQFGVYSLIGVFLTVLAALSFPPAVLSLLPLPKPAPPRRFLQILDQLATTLAKFAVEHRRIVLGGSILLLGISLVGATQIRVGSDFLTAFKPDAPVRIDFEAINDRLGGANALQILVEAENRGALLEPENLKALESFQVWLASQDEVGSATSIVDYLRLLNRAFHDDDPAYFVVPERQRLSSQLLLLAGGDESERLIDGAHRIVNVTALARVGDSASVGALVTRMQERLRELPRELKAVVTGNMVLVSESVNLVAYGQGTSLLVAFGIIYLVLTLLFTSFRVGFLALLPNVLPVATYFGALGLTGITLNTSTGLVGCLCLGIAVDDTIHYFVRFNQDAKRLADEKQATISALRGLIRPVTFTTLGLVLGFLVLTSSELRPQIEFGALAAFTLAVAWAVDVTLSPALCSGLRIVTFWDYMTVDLGHEPQKRIPLLHGLSDRQARIFTLMSDLQKLPAGTPLFREGDPGKDMVVVLEGELRVSLTQDGNCVELGTMATGDTVGEVGLFGEARSADVDVTADARLIRFSFEDLDRLRRRYPRIAAIVYRNLNQIQAERLVRTTRRVR